jgi:anti-sigma factor RsiW
MTQTNQAIDHLDHGHLDPNTLSAFIDAELPSSEEQEIQQHLAGCHPCTLRVLSATRLKAATALAGSRFAPTPDVLTRFTALLQMETKPRSQPKTEQRPRLNTSTSISSIRSPRSIAWTALAAAIVLAASLIGLRQLHQVNSLAAELLDQHLSTLSASATPQVISTDRHTVKPWFQGPSAVQLQPPRRGRLATRHGPQRRKPHLSQRSARGSASLHHPHTRGFGLSHATNHQPYPLYTARHTRRLHPSHSCYARSAYRRRQRRQPGRTRQPYGSPGSGTENHLNLRQENVSIPTRLKSRPARRRAPCVTLG